MIIIKQGEYYEKTLKLEYVDTGEPVPFDSYMKVASSIRDVPGGTIFADATCSKDSTTGTITVTYSQAKTAGIPAGDYGMDVWIKENGKKHPIYESKVKVVPPYTDLSNLDD